MVSHEDESLRGHLRITWFLRFFIVEKMIREGTRKGCSKDKALDERFDKNPDQQDDEIDSDTRWILLDLNGKRIPIEYPVFRTAALDKGRRFLLPRKSPAPAKQDRRAGPISVPRKFLVERG